MTIQVGKDRILRLDRVERAQKQKIYDIEKYDLIDANFKNVGDKKLYKNFNFSVFIDEFCNSACSFCVAELRYETRGFEYRKNKILKNKDDYFKRVRDIFDKIRPYDPSISITGGEPTISPRFPELVKLIDEYDFRKRVVTSNGTGLFRKMPGADATNIDLLMRHNFDHLNISRAAYDEDLNQQLMLYKGRTRTTKEDIGKIVDYIKNDKLDLRLSCVLTKDGVNGFDAIKDYARNFNSNFGVNNIIFRELMISDDGAQNTDVIDWCNAQRVHLDDIWPDFDADPSLKPITSVLGYYYYVEVWNMLNGDNNITITTEASNLQEQVVQMQQHEDVVYEMVFHENGNLTAGWLDDQDILDSYID